MDILPHQPRSPRPTISWDGDTFTKVRVIIRFVLWACVIINAFMLSIFTIGFTYQFLSHTWRWLMRTIFAEDW